MVWVGHVRTPGHPGSTGKIGVRSAPGKGMPNVVPGVPSRLAEFFRVPRVRIPESTRFHTPSTVSECARYSRCAGYRMPKYSECQGASGTTCRRNSVPHGTQSMRCRKYEEFRNTRGADTDTHSASHGTYPVPILDRNI